MVVLAASAEAAGWEADPYLSEQLHIEALLEDALGRLRERGTWKLWHCHLDNACFYDAEAFRQHVTVRGRVPSGWGSDRVLDGGSIDEMGRLAGFGDGLGQGDSQ